MLVREIGSNVLLAVADKINGGNMKIYLCAILVLLLTGCSTSQMQTIERKVGLAPPDPNATVVQIDRNNNCTGGADLTNAQRAQACDAARVEKQRDQAMIAARAKEQEDQREQQKLAQEAMAAAAKEQVKQDEAHGYHYISISDYQLDAGSMPRGRKLIITGFYEVLGSFQTLAQMPSFAVSDEYQIFLLTDGAPRNVRKRLIDLQRSVPCGSRRVCRLTVLGHIASCQQTFMGKVVRDTVCLAVDDIRNP